MMDTLSLHPLITLALAVSVWLISSARLTRLITQDPFPPVAWLRIKWDAATEDSEWNDLAHCHWCASPWVVAVMGAWGYFTDLHWTWWVISIWLSISYLAAIIVHRDED